jgi:hypothetical protein
LEGEEESGSEENLQLGTEGDPIVRKENKTKPAPGGPGSGQGGGGQGSGGQGGNPGGGNPGGGNPGGGGGAPPPGGAEAPSQFEGIWTFYNYCLFAEDEIESEKIKQYFPNQKYFEAWLKDIQRTVAAIRIRLKQPRRPDLASTESCRKAYDEFLQRRVFSLAPNPAAREAFEINNVEPISGLPDLQDLDLYDNKIVNIKMLRNLAALRYLELGKNLIKQVPPLENTVARVGLFNLIQIGLEFQDALESPLKIDGLSVLAKSRAFLRLKIAGNLVEPTPLRGLADNLEVVHLSRLWFVPGTVACYERRSGKGYPLAVEKERAAKCD